MCKINGRMVTVNELKEFMSKFIEIHGQNEQIGLLNSSNHREILDQFGNLLDKRNIISNIFEKMKTSKEI